MHTQVSIYVHTYIRMYAHTYVASSVHGIEINAGYRLSHTGLTTYHTAGNECYVGIISAKRQYFYYPVVIAAYVYNPFSVFKLELIARHKGLYN